MLKIKSISTKLGHIEMSKPNNILSFNRQDKFEYSIFIVKAFRNARISEKVFYKYSSANAWFNLLTIVISEDEMEIAA